MKNIFWTAYCRESRFVAVHKVEDIVGEFGFITDFKQFSDVSISIKIEIEENRIQEMYHALNGYIEMNPPGEEYSDSPRERNLYINITFTQSEGNVRRDVPQV
ncbi:MAG: hypothetical protein SchgKO_11150 [Schleiferiaceae bacterium]